MQKKVSFLAAIEVGSHETILKITQVLLNGEISEVESMSRTINLGSDSYRLGYITNENVSLLINTLTDFKRMISVYPEIKVIAACTSAVREASNRMFIIDQIYRKTGFTIKIYSNRLEMAGMLKAIRFKMPEFDQITKKTTLLLDIGAGSTQLTLFDESKFTFTQNILLGSLRVRDHLSILEQHTADFISLMLEYISGDIDYYRSFVPNKMNYDHFVLVGNDLATWRYIADLPLTGTVQLTIDKFNELYNTIIHSSTLELISKFDINEEQASLLLPVSMVIKELFEFTGLNYLIMPDAILADGLIINLARKLRLIKKDSKIMHDAISFAKQIAGRHHPDLRHIEQVEKLSIQLFDQLQEFHGLNRRHKFLLQISANLHNIGKFFTVEQDGAMAYQMIKSLDLVGLTDQEVEIIALLVYHHKDDLFKLAANNIHLPPDEQVVFAKLAVLLGLANTLDTGHKSKVKQIKTEKRKKHIKIILLSDQDLTLESWSFRRPARFFQEIFGMELRLSIVPEG